MARPTASRPNEQYAWTADCASIESNRAPERCTFSRPASGVWHILVYGYHAYYGANLTVTLTP